jgi:hypothetical protein
MIHNLPGTNPTAHSLIITNHKARLRKAKTFLALVYTSLYVYIVLQIKSENNCAHHWHNVRAGVLNETAAVDKHTHQTNKNTNNQRSEKPNTNRQSLNIFK